jgi:hypothetical protein
MHVPTAEEKFTAADAAATVGISIASAGRRMRTFIDLTVSDMLSGRESWRVLSALGSIAFAAGILWALA